jgi:hypothetical protein
MTRKEIPSPEDLFENYELCDVCGNAFPLEMITLIEGSFNACDPCRERHDRIIDLNNKVMLGDVRRCQSPYRPTTCDNYLKYNT